MSDDEITLREAAELLAGARWTDRGVSTHHSLIADSDLDEEAAREKRRREVGNAGATLEAMLGASRRGRTVRGQK